MRLIDGSALLKELRKAQKECEKDGEESGGEAVLIAVGLDDACDYVKNAPTIDPAKHGKWIQLENTSPAYGECSECGSMRLKENYCPRCGAKMDL